MIDFINTSPQTIAETLAGFDIAPLQNVLKKQSTTLKAQKTSVDELRRALGDFRTALAGLNQSNNNQLNNGMGMLQNRVSLNQEGIARVDANSGALKGSYRIDIKQLASAHQLGFDGLTDQIISKATGEMRIVLGEAEHGNALSINLDQIENLSDLARIINGSRDNPGITASLIRTDGQVLLMLSSDHSGAKYQIGIDSQRLDVDSRDHFANPNEIAAAQDALFRLGNIEFTQPSNTLDQLVDGLSIELNAVTRPGNPLQISVGTDTAATSKQLQTFVNAVNLWRDSFSKLTQVGSKGGDERGALAGDAMTALLDRELNALLRTPFNGKRLADFGITANRESKLTLDHKALNQQISADPRSLNSLFNGNDRLLQAMDKSLGRYLNASNGPLEARRASLDRRQNELDSKAEAINRRYDTAYNRYLKEFIQLQKSMAQMDNSLQMFQLT